MQLRQQEKLQKGKTVQREEKNAKKLEVNKNEMRCVRCSRLLMIYSKLFECVMQKKT